MKQLKQPKAKIKALFNNDTLEATIYCMCESYKSELDDQKEELKYARLDKSEYHIEQAKERIKELKAKIKELKEAYFIIYGYVISD